MTKKSRKPNRNRNLPARQQNTSQSSTSSQLPNRPIARVEARLESFSGPLPNPALLKAYDDILPGCAERIICMAESQANHRQSLEKTVIEGDTRRADKGLLAGFIVALVGLGSAVALVLTGHDLAGFALGGLDLVSLVSVFVYGTITRRSERAKKAEQMQRVIQP
jgi:uncharacterized membrane protein